MRSSARHGRRHVLPTIALCIYSITQFFVCEVVLLMSAMWSWCWSDATALADYVIMMIINLFEVAVCPTYCRLSVLRRFFAGGAAAGHTDTIPVSPVCCSRSSRSRYNRRTVYGMRLRLRTIGLPAWTKLIIHY